MDKGRLWSDRLFLPTCSRYTHGGCFLRSGHARCLLQPPLSQQTPTRTSSLGASTTFPVVCVCCKGSPRAPMGCKHMQSKRTWRDSHLSQVVLLGASQGPVDSGCVSLVLETETYKVLRGRSGGDGKGSCWDMPQKKPSWDKGWEGGLKSSTGCLGVEGLCGLSERGVLCSNRTRSLHSRLSGRTSMDMKLAWKRSVHRDEAS